MQREGIVRDKRYGNTAEFLALLRRFHHLMASGTKSGSMNHGNARTLMIVHLSQYAPRKPFTPQLQSASHHLQKNVFSTYNSPASENRYMRQNTDENGQSAASGINQMGYHTRNVLPNMSCAK